MVARIVIPILFSIALQAKITDGLENIYCQRNNWKYICDFVYETPSFNPSRVKRGNTIYATGHNIDRFFATMHHRIQYPYILVTMDGGVLPRYIDDPKVIAWFANESYTPVMHHPKFTMIPLGLFQETGPQNTLCDRLRQFHKNPKQQLVYLNFNVTPFGYRKEIYQMFKDKPFVFVGSLAKSYLNRRPFLQYMEEMSHFKFAFSPFGDACDCYRHWEAIMVGTIPILRRWVGCDTLFEGLPVLFIDDWAEVTEEFLHQKYEEIRSKEYDLSKVCLKYWAQRIEAVKRAYVA